MGHIEVMFRTSLMCRSGSYQKPQSIDDKQRFEDLLHPSTELKSYMK